MPRWSYFRIQICREQCDEPATVKGNTERLMCLSGIGTLNIDRLQVHFLPYSHGIEIFARSLGRASSTRQSHFTLR